MNVALTGSRGFIGSHLKTRLENDGHKVIEWDLRQNPSKCIILSIYRNCLSNFV